LLHDGIETDEVEVLSFGVRFLRRSAFVLVLLAAGAGPSMADTASDAIQATLQASGVLALDGHALDRTALTMIYQKRTFQPIWDDAHQQSFQHALEEADSHGLDASSYNVSATEPTTRDVLLTDAFLRYASALARGRVAPTNFETDWRIPSPAFDADKVMNAVIAGDVSVVLAGLAPHDQAYERLRVALTRYRALAEQPWHGLFISNQLAPGDHDDIIPALRERLVAEGYLQPADRDDPTLYDPALSAAVSHYQTTHGLPIDGALGKLTVASLNISPDLRVRQIRWNLERWRSMPRVFTGNRIEINIPAATATLYDGDQPVRAIRAIVGAAIHPTPVMRTRMSSVTLNPYWNVPASIIEKEIRPMLKRDSNYLKRFNFAYVETRSGGGTHLVQLPGPGNSLGQVKFEMPNIDDVYMHDTPEKRVFGLARRYMSHGCVRVENPRELARIVLDSDQWSRNAIDQAIATGQTQSVALKHSLPVYFLYWTAFSDADGTVEFRDDIYGRDQRLAGALAAREAAERLAVTENVGTRG
jgi:murein L,D-transpeptidase YcbB/YkuD